jgi:hypothetical protein
MNQSVLLLLLNRYSKGQALYHKITSKKLPSQLSWFNQNKRASLEFDILPTYQNSTRRSLLSSYPIYNIEKTMIVVVFKLAESLAFIFTRIYQNSTKPSNLVLLKSIYQTMPKTACNDKELKMIGSMILLTKSADRSKVCAPVHIFTRLPVIRQK